MVPRRGNAQQQFCYPGLIAPFAPFATSLPKLFPKTLVYPLHSAILVVIVKQDVLLYLEQLYQNNCPEFIYYKTLFHIFETFLDDLEKSDILSEQLHLFDTEIWKSLFEFQKDGVKAAINKIRRYNGCIIADSVGLGKTFEALAVIKYAD